MNLPPHLEQYVYVSIYTLVGLAFGFLVEKILLKQLHKLALRTAWKYDDAIIESLRGLIVVWFMLLGHSIATNAVEVNDTFNKYSNNISLSILILSLSIFTVRALVRIFTLSTADPSGNQASSSIVLNIIRIVIMLIGFMLILQVFGVSIAPLLTALGVGGLAVALALQETLSNLFAGIQVIASKKIRNGDYVKLDSGQEGRITDVTWRNTIIKGLNNNLIIIPNSKLSSAIVTNFDFPETELTLTVDAGVSFDSDLAFVEKITLETAREIIKTMDGCVKNSEPTLRYKAFAESSVNFSVTFRIVEFEYQFVVRHEFLKALHKKFKEAGIEIPFPVRTVVMKK